MTIPNRDAVTKWMGDYLIKELQLKPDAIGPDVTFDTYGLDSLEQAVMVGMMEDAFEIEIEIDRAFATPTIRGVADALVATGLVQDG